MVRQAKIEVIKFFVYLVLSVFYIFSLVKFVKFAIVKHGEASIDGEVGWGMAILFSILIGLGLSIGILVSVNHAIDALLNPEYWALQQILKFVK